MRRPVLWSRTATFHADIWSRPQYSEGSPFELRIHSLQYQFTKHGDKSGIDPDGLCPGHRERELFTELTRFYIEVIQHFHVIGDKADWR